MSSWLWRACVGGFVATALTACTLKNANVPPEELMRQFQAGQPMLDCRFECGSAWGAQRQRAATLDATGQWKDLALLVMQIGYEDDLTYYYLGHAAENLGYLQAAERYYRIAENLSATQMACARGEASVTTTLGLPANSCSGYVFPDALYPRLAAVEARLAAASAPTTPRPARRVVRRPPSQTPTATSAPGPGQTPSPGFVEPAPTATPSSGSGFVEPAPASSDQFTPPAPVR
jgi:hypothetical protein